ncbi:ribokinase [Flexivirga sp. B27]
MTACVVVVGSINVDRTIVLDRFPQPGETLLATSLTESVGGKGANQAVAAARSGASVVMAGVLGTDPEGDTALRALQDAGVDCGPIHRFDDEPTGSAWITVASGDNTILVVPGANHRWTDLDLPVRDDDILLCQLEIPLQIVELAASGPGRFVLNAAPGRPLPNELLRRCEVLIVNEHELATVSGTELSCDADPEAVVSASRMLLDRGAHTVVTTLGGRGAISCTTERALYAAAPSVDVVDTTGAGDAFCGVYCAELAAGACRARALRSAVTAGSLAVRSPTAQGSYAELTGLDTSLAETPEVRTLFGS